MNRVWLTRAVPVTALGDGLEPLWQGLLEGRSGIAELSRFATGNYCSRLAACVEGLHPSASVSLLDPLLERVAARFAAVPGESRLLLASTKGEIDLLEQSCRQQLPVPEAALFEPLLQKVARRFGLEESGLNINAACASSTIAVARAAAMIAHGQADSVLVVAIDAVSEFVFSGFSALRALSARPSRPFDRARDGLNLGEGAVALLLMSEERARSLGEEQLAEIVGWGCANDAHHVTAPARDGCGLILACRQALKRAALQPQQIAGINAHGTGTVYNDAMELTAFSVLFGDALPPLHGLKGSVGHCLGAAGGIEVAVACRSLQQQLLPGTHGCVEPEAAAVGRVGQQPQELDGDYLLCTNSGFGGINGTLILKRGGA